MSKGYEIVPERGGQFQDPTPRRKTDVVKSTDGDLDQQAARDFLDNVKSRKRPNADVEEGHRSTTFAHLANIALTTRKRLDWDAQAERFHQLRRGQPAPALRVSQALEPGVARASSDRRADRLADDRRAARGRAGPRRSWRSPSRAGDCGAMPCRGRSSGSLTTTFRGDCDPMTVVVRSGTSTDVAPPSITSVGGSPTLLLTEPVGAGTTGIHAGEPEYR